MILFNSIHILSLFPFADGDILKKLFLLPALIRSAAAVFRLSFYLLIAFKAACTQAGESPTWRLKYLSAAYRIRFDFIINRLYFFLHSKVLTEPDEEIDKEENSDIARYTPKAMRHPVHTVSNRQH